MVDTNTQLKKKATTHFPEVGGKAGKGLVVLPIVYFREVEGQGNGRHCLVKAP